MHLRVRFAKTGKVRWTSHRDVARMWERAFRRISLPLAYTGGFSPRPKVSFGLALPTGAESIAEYLDVELAEGVDVDGAELDRLVSRLTNALPVGVDVLAAVPLDHGARSLQHEVTSCTWEIELAPREAPIDLAAAVERALAAATLVVTRERKGRVVSDDIRTAILALNILNADRIGCELATLERGVRPAELLRAVDPSLEESRVLRTHQWIERDGARWEPIPPAATDAPRAGMCAS